MRRRIGTLIGWTIVVMVGCLALPLGYANPVGVSFVGGPCAGGEHQDEAYVDVEEVPFTWDQEDEHLDPQEGLTQWPVTDHYDGFFVNQLPDGDFAYFDYITDERVGDVFFHIYEWYGLSAQHNCETENLCPEAANAAEILDWVSRARNAVEQGDLQNVPVPPICDL